jgi:hypothetical protein
MDLWGDEGPALARPTRLSSGTHGAVPAVAVPAGTGSRDSGSVARRQCAGATSPSPSVWPLMAADRPVRVGHGPGRLLAWSVAAAGCGGDLE